MLDKLLTDLTNIIPRIKQDEGAVVSRTELQYILDSLKELKGLREKYRLLLSGK